MIDFKGADGEGNGGGEEGDAARRPLTRRLHSGLFPNIKTAFRIRRICMFSALVSGSEIICTDSDSDPYISKQKN